MEHWKVLAERRLLETDRVKVSAQSVRLPCGKVVDDFYQVAIADYITVFATTQAGSIICLRQYKHGMRRVALTLPGGVIDPGETPLIAAQRELREETGYACTHWGSLGSYVVNGNQRIAMAHFFLASGGKKVGACDSGDLEEMDVCLLSRDEVLDGVARGVFPILSHTTSILLALQKPNGSQ